jgi:hypothetical protein
MVELTIYAGVSSVSMSLTLTCRISGPTLSLGLLLISILLPPADKELNSRPIAVLHPTTLPASIRR